MKFKPYLSGQKLEQALDADWDAAAAADRYRVGGLAFYIPAAFSAYYIPLDAIRGIHAEKQAKYLKVCCWSGDVDMPALHLETAEGEIVLPADGMESAREAEALVRARIGAES